MTITSERIDAVVTVLAKASAQDYTVRVPILGTDDAFLEIEVGVNVLLEDLGIAHDRAQQQLRELEVGKELAERQAAALRELSTPIITVWGGILALPIVGTVDTTRSAEMMETLLQRVVDDQASHVIIDITGVQVLDTRTADHFLRMAKAVNLLGAECYLTGLSPAIAETLSQLGIDFQGLKTLRRLSDALRNIFETSDAVTLPVRKQALR